MGAIVNLSRGVIKFNDPTLKRVGIDQTNPVNVSVE
jgi:hypothetical protein